MTVYSYISESTLLTIADVANEEIGTYADLIVSTFSATRSKFVNAKGQLEESIVYDYNESSVVGPEGEDYGLISNSAIISEDYGSITESDYYPWQQEDYGSIINDTTLRPFGRLYAVNNTPAESLSRTSEINGVHFLLYGNSNVSVLPLIYGSGYLVAYGESSQKQTASYVGSGSLLGFSGGVEKVTVSYNQSSIVNPISDDYGSIASAIVDQDDYGTLLEDTYYPWQQEDYGFITNNESIFPYGNINIEGNVVEKLSSRIISAGEANIKGIALVLVTPKHVGTGSIFVSGEVYVKEAPKWIGSGILFNFTNKVEKRTYSYNGSAYVGTFGDDYGFINQSPISEEDYGSLIENTYYPWQQEDYGFLEPDGTLIPYGRIKFGGSADESFSSSFIGSGGANLNGEADILVVPKELGKVLFDIVGTAIERNAESYVGEGSLFKFSSKVEKRTYVYNGSAYVGTFGDDYGFINQSPISEEDYGLLSGDPYYPWQQEDYGFLEPDGTLIPYGKIKISGTTVDKFYQTYSYIGSGNITISGEAVAVPTPKEFGAVLYDINGEAIIGFSLSHVGSGSFTVSNVIDKNINPDIRFFTQIESVGWDPPEFTQIFAISGSADDKFDKVYSYVGFGRIFLGEKVTPVFQLKHIGSGSVNVRGFAEVPKTKLYIGSGSLFAFVGGQESSSPSPEIGSGIIKISGFSSERNIESYSGSGQIKASGTPTIGFKLSHNGSGTFNIDGVGQESISPSPHIGSGTFDIDGVGQESSSPSPEIGSGIIKISGFSSERNIESYSGSGQIKASGTPTIGFKLSHNGSGSIFNFSNVTESTVKFVSVTQIFKIVGSSTERSVDSYIASGSFDIGGSAQESFAPAAYKGTGSIFGFVGASESSTVSKKSEGLFDINGSSEVAFIRSDITTGSINVHGSSVAVFSIRVISSGYLVVDGSAQESFAPAFYNGEGRLYSNVQSSEVVVYVPVSKGTVFTFTGTASEKNTEAHSGSGSIDALSGSAEVFAAIYNVTRVLFAISGTALESYVQGSFREEGNINIVGKSQDRYVEYKPPKPARIYII